VRCLLASGREPHGTVSAPLRSAFLSAMRVCDTVCPGWVSIGEALPRAGHALRSPAALLDVRFIDA